MSRGCCLEDNTRISTFIIINITIISIKHALTGKILPVSNTDCAKTIVLSLFSF